MAIDYLPGDSQLSRCYQGSPAHIRRPFRPHKRCPALNSGWPSLMHIGHVRWLSHVFNDLVMMLLISSWLAAAYEILKINKKSIFSLVITDNYRFYTSNKEVWTFGSSLLVILRRASLNREIIEKTIRYGLIKRWSMLINIPNRYYRSETQCRFESQPSIN